MAEKVFIASVVVGPLFYVAYYVAIQLSDISNQVGYKNVCGFKHGEIFVFSPFGKFCAAIESSFLKYMASTVFIFFYLFFTLFDQTNPYYMAGTAVSLTFLVGVEVNHYLKQQGQQISFSEV